jgi:hypothetical protein
MKGINPHEFKNIIPPSSQLWKQRKYDNKEDHKKKKNKFCDK